MTQIAGNHTHEEQAFLLANFLPTGKAFSAKSVAGTNIYDLLLGLSKNDVRLEDLTNVVMNELFITTTESLISLFEEMVGIPDDCFNTNVSLEQRKKQVIFKLTCKADTAESFIAIANFFGYACEIGYPDINTYPLEYPWIYSSYAETANTIIIYLPESLNAGSTYPLEYPWIYSSQAGSNFLECIFERIKPATAQIIFRYTLPG